MAREVAQWLGVLAALAEDLGWVPAPTGGSSQPLVTQVPGAPMSSSDTSGIYTHMVHIHTSNLTHIHVRFKNLQIKQLNECVNE